MRYAFMREKPAKHAPREPLLTLREVAAKLGVPWRSLAMKSPPARLVRGDVNGRGYYRMSDVRKWWAEIHGSPES